MRNDTRKHFNNFAAQVAKLNGVPDATQKFAVDPTIQQRLEKRIQESSDFLSRINMVGVDELKDENKGSAMAAVAAARFSSHERGRALKDSHFCSCSIAPARSTHY